MAAFLLLSTKNLLQGQSTLIFSDSTTITIQEIRYKTPDKLYFLKSDSLFYIHKSEFSSTTFGTWSYELQKNVELSTDWDNIIPSGNEFKSINKIEMYKKYANRSSAGIVMTLVVPAVTSVLALQQGVVEIAYIGLASSAIGIGLWLSGIQQLRTALELGEAIHYTRKTPTLQIPYQSLQGRRMCMRADMSQNGLYIVFGRTDILNL